MVRCDRRTAGLWARAFEAALTVALGLEGGFRPAHILPVRDAPHSGALRPYVLGQNEKHELPGDPLLEGSNALDLLSVRLVDRDSARRLKEALPSTRTSDIDRWLGGPLKPGSDVRWLPEACEVVTAGTADSLGPCPAPRSSTRHGSVRSETNRTTSASGSPQAASDAR
ncbi:MAG: hypothetical protein GY913_16755 [Proteobacteria bacterium]|nr:hypothetical protein [Pseudomonadota bacterium]MCP4918555.1 hypothetical protein [Pseudomonadota bacterium]